jgi:C1A family cysteine protease
MSGPPKVTKPTPRKSPNPDHHFGWVRDLPDQRDRKYARRVVGVARAGAPTQLPPSVDLRPQCPPIVNQGQLGSCTANALAGALGFLEIKDGLAPQPFSRLYIYYNERVIEGTVSSDSGAQLRDGIKTLSQGDQGACYETTWPYNISQFAVEPPPAAYTQGEAHEITVYEALQSLDDMKDCLASGYPFVFGFTVYQSFETPQVASTGVVPMPTPKEQTIGGHAVVAVGYDDASSRFICRNSWGLGWGINGTGYFYMPYAYLSNPNLASDFWTISKGTEMLKPNST